jgi:hypothetical protein
MLSDILALAGSAVVYFGSAASTMVSLHLVRQAYFDAGTSGEHSDLHIAAGLIIAMSASLLIRVWFNG